MAQEQATAPTRGNRGRMLIWGLVVVLAAGGGAVVPWLLPHRESAEKKTPEPQPSGRVTVVPFGDVAVNLAEERLTRYLRCKILLVVEESDSKEVTEALGKQKAFLKSWLISYLADQSLLEVSRAIGVNRIRREIHNQFNAMLYPDGTERIRDILFDEFVVQ